MVAGDDLVVCAGSGGGRRPGESREGHVEEVHSEGARLLATLGAEADECLGRVRKKYRVGSGVVYIAFKVMVGFEVDFISHSAAETASCDFGWCRHTLEL